MFDVHFTTSLSFSDMINSVQIYIYLSFFNDRNRLSSDTDPLEDNISSIGSVLNPLSIVGHMFTTMLRNFGTCVFEGP